MIDPTAFIHLRAEVVDVTIGAWTKVWQFASITRKAVIGAECVIAPGAMIDGSRIGDRSKVGPGVKMGPGFVIGADVFLGPNVVLCNDAWPVADVEGFDLDGLLSGRIVAVVIGDGASVGANATILPGVRLGAGSMVAAGAVVGRNVPAGHLFKRDGSVVEIVPAMKRRRMRGVA